MHVSNLTNKSGRPVLNQFVIECSDSTYFQSYDSVIAQVYRDGTIHLGPDWDYSRTTGKYLHQFLADYAGRPDLCTKKAIQNAIDEGLDVFYFSSEFDIK